MSVQSATSLRRLYAAAGLAGACLANASVLVPLVALAHHGSASLAGAMLALITVAIAAGALASGRAVAALGERTLLSASFAVLAAGQLTAMLLGAQRWALGAGALAIGSGLGVFWVASQSTLAHAAGDSTARGGFVRHYVSYVVGSALSAPATGLAVHILHGLGAEKAAALHLAFAVGLLAALLGPWIYPPERARAARLARALAMRPRRALVDLAQEMGPGRCRPARGSQTSAAPAPVPWRRVWQTLKAHLDLQLPDLLLVSALSLLATLAPVVLTRELHFSAATVGIVVGALAAGKIAGSLLAERAVRTWERGALVASMLTLAALSSATLAMTSRAPLFVAMLILAVLGAAGAWPVIVEGALRGVSAEQRRTLAVVWNVREYGAIAASTVAGGWLLASFPTWVSLALAAGCLAVGAALAARTHGTPGAPGHSAPRTGLRRPPGPRADAAPRRS
jgi:MFS family permease